MFTQRRPTLVGTLGHMAQVSWAIWRDYRDDVRARRRSRRNARRYATALHLHTPGWRSDAAHVAAIVVAALATLSLALYVADAWPLVFDFVRWSA